MRGRGQELDGWLHQSNHVTSRTRFPFDRPFRTIINIHHVHSPFAEVVSYSVPKYCHNSRSEYCVCIKWWTLAVPLLPEEKGGGCRLWSWKGR
ncbi:hypothetical protein NPIL_53571 [Nephila pilipes]|uniref:Uncharacterized protein n=1 Tax=Nephila pilipes TaxID=299642 RepID=A0A8X6PCA4_NEPPI|nr:hypothetical protein NPIL_53571 [Nephila pilipes]